jgi:Zn-dependent protease with chaperone function
VNFFEAQEEARRRSHLLVGLFLLAVLGIILAVYLVVLVAAGLSGVALVSGFDPGLFAIVAGGTLLLIGGGSAFRWSQLRKGGPAVASLLGGRRIQPDTRDPDERRLVNVVEEMSLAAGIPVPALFVLDAEESINAFAAGYGIHDAAVAVTRGTLERLNRDELQGVVAHEFSHVLNGDMRLNIRLVGLLFGILLLAVIGRGLMRGAFWGRRRDRDARAALVGLALVALGYIGVFFGKLIKAAVSRQREFLADAAAVQFTRNPQGLAGALKKIGGHPRGGRIQDHHAEELSHLFFADGLGTALTRITATHPPLEERIRRVDPGWDGRFPKPEPRGSASDRDARDPRSSPSARPPATPALSPVAGAATAAAVLSAVGAPSARDMAFARDLLIEIPDRLQEAAHHRAGSQALVLALVGGQTDEDRNERRRAARALDESMPPPAEDGAHPTQEPGGHASVVEWLSSVEDPVARLPARSRLPLLDLCLPTLASLPSDQVRHVRAAAEQVIRVDGRIRPFDFALIHALWRRLSGTGDRGRERGSPLRSLSSAAPALEVILSALAWTGHDKPDDAGRAFDAGIAELDGSAGPLKLRAASEVDLRQVDQALQRLERGTLALRRKVLTACAATALADQEIHPEEMELLRAIAECLELPLPPSASR